MKFVVFMALLLKLRREWIVKGLKREKARLLSDETSLDQPTIKSMKKIVIIVTTNTAKVRSYSTAWANYCGLLMLGS